MNGTVSNIFLIQTTSKQLKKHLGQYAPQPVPMHHSGDCIWTKSPIVLLTWTTKFVNYNIVTTRRTGRASLDGLTKG